MFQRILLTAILFVSAFSGLNAQTSSTTTTTSTTNTTKEEYSNINGAPVPVGERNKYLFSYKKFNVWTNPFGYFVGSFNIGGSYALNENIKVNFSPTFIYYFSSNPKVIGGGGTLSSTIFFKKIYDGFYLEPGAGILYLSQKRSIGTAKGVVGGPQLIGGWGWVWDSNFTINLGMGVGYYWGDTGKDIDDTEAFEGIFPVGNLQFGYTF